MTVPENPFSTDRLKSLPGGMTRALDFAIRAGSSMSLACSGLKALQFGVSFLAVSAFGDLVSACNLEIDVQFVRCTRGESPRGKGLQWFAVCVRGHPMAGAVFAAPSFLNSSEVPHCLLSF